MGSILTIMLNPFFFCQGRFQGFTMNIFPFTVQPICIEYLGETGEGMTDFIKPKKVKKPTGKTEEKIEEKNWSQWEADSSSEVNRQRFKNIFDPNTMFEAREILFPKGEKGVVCYFDDLVISAEVNEHVITPLLEYGPDARLKDLEEKVITSKKVRQFETLKDAVGFLTSGGTIVHVDGMNYFIGVAAPGFPARSVEEPQAEPLVRGPREGFTETLQVNSALIRKRLRTPDLKSEELKIGRRSQTTILIMYVDGLVNDEVLQTLKNRMGKIDIDVLLESAQLEELIEDDMFSPFPQIVHTERPDKVVAGLAEGRVALLIDGTPFSLIVPSVFSDFMQASEDYYERFYFSTAIRILRMFTFFIALLVPSIYVAVTTFHQELIPSPLLYTIISARAGVPFPIVIEAFLMEISFEILREAGVRLPRPVGSAVSIVGALVVGQAAVDAGIVSQPMVIVVALTGIASFTIPAFNMSMSTRLLRFPIMFIAATMGLFGIAISLMILGLHMCALRSFGVPYMTPVAPLHLKSWKSEIFLFPFFFRRIRPVYIQKHNLKKNATKPHQEERDK